jgi:HEAT repeat protein
MSPYSETLDEGARCKAVEELANRADNEALGVLLLAAKDESWRVRKLATRQLSQFKPEELVSVIRDTVSGVREPSVRNIAMDALVRQGESALDVINTLLRETNWEMRLHGAVMLGNIRSAKSVEPLAVLLSDDQENVIHAAAESLGSIGDARAIPFLVNVLRSQEFWSQYPAVIALGRIGHHSATADLLEFVADDMLSPAVVDALGLIGDPRALQPLIRLLPVEGEPVVSYNQLLRAIVRIVTSSGVAMVFPPSLVEPVYQAVAKTLASEELDDRIAALLVAGWSADARLIPLIEPRLSFDAEQEVALEALRGMGEAAVPALTELLESSLPSVRRSSIRLLSDVGHSLDGVLRHIIDHDETVRMEVALAVGRSGRPELTEYLLEMLLDESDDVRRVALEVLASLQTEAAVREQLYRRLEYYPDDRLPTIIETLGRLRVPDVLPKLRALIEAPHGEDVRAAVVRAVRDLGVESGGADLLLKAVRDPAPQVRGEAIRAISALQGEEAFEAVAACVGDSDAHCAYAAVTALGQLGNAKAIPILETIASSDAGEMGLRVEAVRSLGKLQAQGSARALVQLLSKTDEDVRREVTKALSKLQGRDAFDGLVRACMDSFWAVRATAVAALSLQGQAGMSYVLRGLDDPDDLVRKAAVRGLEHAGPSMTLRLYPLLADDKIEDVVTQTLERFGSRIVSYVGDATEHSDPTMRLRLARLLGRVGGAEARSLLEKMLTDPVMEVAEVAEKALAPGEGGA